MGQELLEKIKLLEDELKKEKQGRKNAAAMAERKTRQMGRLKAMLAEANDTIKMIENDSSETIGALREEITKLTH